MGLYDSLASKECGNEPTNHDLAVLADWAEEMHDVSPNNDWKRAFAELRAGADRLLRRRARAQVTAKISTLAK